MRSLTYHDAVWRRQLLQSCGRVGCHSDQGIEFHCIAVSKSPRDHHAGLDPYPDREVSTARKRCATGKNPNFFCYCESSGNRRVSVATDRTWISKTGQHAITDIAGDVASVLVDGSCAPLTIGHKQRGKFFGVEPLRERTG